MVGWQVLTIVFFDVNFFLKDWPQMTIKDELPGSSCSKGPGLVWNRVLVSRLILSIPISCAPILSFDLYLLGVNNTG